MPKWEIDYRPAGPRESLIKTIPAQPKMVSFGPGQDNAGNWNTMMNEVHKINGTKPSNVPPAGNFAHLTDKTNITGHDLTVNASYNGHNTAGSGVVHLDGKPHKIRFSATPDSATIHLNGAALDESHPVHQKLSEHLAAHWPDSASGNLRNAKMKL